MLYEASKKRKLELYKGASGNLLVVHYINDGIRAQIFPTKSEPIFEAFDTCTTLHYFTPRHWSRLSSFTAFFCAVIEGGSNVQSNARILALV